jgi:putative DNA primase/helicase
MQLGGGMRQLWACLSTSGLRTIEIPEHITHVGIYADFDDAITEGPHAGQRPGTMAAEACADRLTKQGRSVSIEYPAHDFGDFNDQLLLRGGK